MESVTRPTPWLVSGRARIPWGPDTKPLTPALCCLPPSKGPALFSLLVGMKGPLLPEGLEEVVRPVTFPARMPQASSSKATGGQHLTREGGCSPRSVSLKCIFFYQ